MRIAYVCADPGIPPWGSKGASIHVQEMLRAFIARGAQVTLLSPRLDGAPPADLAAVVTIALPPAPAGMAAEARADQLLATNEVVTRALDDLASDGQGPIDLVYERHALFAHGAVEWAEARGTMSILEVNAPLIEEQARHRSLPRPEEAQASARRAFSRAGLVVAVTADVARYAVALGASTTCVHVIANGVNPARFPPRPAAGGPFTVGFLGTLKPWHDVATLVEALALLRAGPVPEAQLLIVGDGPERDAIVAKLHRLGLKDAATLTGALSASEVPQELARMHAAAAPYRGDGPFYFSPLKVYEYMAAGLPVVASRVGDLDRVVSHGRTGLMVPPDDASALADALARLAGDPDLRANLGGAARAEVLAQHTWDGVATRVLELGGLAPRRAA